MRILLIVLLGVAVMGCSRSAETYWPTGEVRERGETSFGKKTGEWVMYSGDGHVRARGRYESDKRTGRWEYYRSDGSLEEVEYYDPGLERIANGLYWTASYDEKGETMLSIVDVGRDDYSGMSFVRQEGDTWQVMDLMSDISSETHVQIGTVVPREEGEGYTFEPAQHIKADAITLPADPMEWARRIRSEVPVDPRLKDGLRGGTE